MFKECKNPQCRILFEARSNRQELCADCYIKKRRNDLVLGRKRYKMRNSKEQLGNERQDEAIIRFLREKTAREDRRYRENF